MSEDMPRKYLRERLSLRVDTSQRCYSKSDACNINKLMINSLYILHSGGRGVGTHRVPLLTPRRVPFLPEVPTSLIPAARINCENVTTYENVL